MEKLKRESQPVPGENIRSNLVKILGTIGAAGTDGS
jgi:hypothetical protein